MRTLFLIATLALAQAPPPNALVVVEGIVTDTERGAPLSSVRVELQGGPSFITTFTGPDGRFRLSAPPKEYQLWAERPGFYGAVLNGIRSSAVTRRLILVPGQQTPELVLGLTPAGVITGRVLSPAGFPVNNATISAARIRRNDRERFLEKVRTTNTNELGEYRLYWLPPGDYWVMVDQEERSVAPSPTLISGADSTNVLLRTYYPGTPRFDAASLVTVPAGSEVKGTDFSIQASTTFKISGRVVSPVPGINLPPEFVLIHSDFGMQEIRIPSYSNAQGPLEARTGLFELRGIPPGRYDLYAHMRNATPGVTYSGKTSIEIRAQDLKDLVIPLHQPVDVRGHVIVTGDLKPPLNVSVGLAYLGNLQGMSFAGSNADVDANGEFVVKGLPEGEYRIYAQILRAGNDAYIADLKQGSLSVLNDGIVKISGDAPAGIEVVVAPGPGRVSGTVVHPEGKQGVDTIVVLVPEPSLRSNPTRFRNFPTRNVDSFNMLVIPPGRYKIFAWEGAPASAWLDPEFLAKYENQGIDITVTGGQATAINVPVIWLK